MVFNVTFNNISIIEGKYGLKRDPPCLTILDVQMSDSGDYYCCIEYSTSDVKKTVKSEKAHLTIRYYKVSHGIQVS
jgi:hypothetical protein